MASIMSDASRLGRLTKVIAPVLAQEAIPAIVTGAVASGAGKSLVHRQWRQIHDWMGAPYRGDGVKASNMN